MCTPLASRCPLRGFALLAACLTLTLGACRTTAPIHPPGSAALIGCAGNGELDWIHLDSGKRKRTYATAQIPDEVLVAPTGGQVAVLDRTAETITVFDIVDRVQRRVIALPAGSRPTDIEFLDRRSRLGVSCPGSGLLIEVGLNTGGLLTSIDCGGSPVALATAFERETVAVALHEPNALVLLDLATGNVIRRTGLPAAPTALAVHPSRNEVWVTAAQADTLLVVEPESARLRMLPCAGGPQAVRMSYDGKTVLVLCAGSGEIAAFDVATHAERWRVSPPLAKDGTPAQPSGIELEPPGVHLLVVSRNANRLDEVDIASGKWVRSLPTAPGPISVGWLRIRQPGRFVDDRGHL